MGAVMFIRDHNENRPNYLVEAAALTVIAICIGVNMFGDNLGFTTMDSKPADGFDGFKIVNTSHHHHHELAN